MVFGYEFLELQKIMNTLVDNTTNTFFIILLI